ncbi:MAG: transketolase C-terminal domain-containing protein [Candidatus Gottesmanbacteria bacterium]
MRTAFVNSLIKLADKDKRVVLLTGDLGYGVLEKFRDKFPDRFLNCGVAEANMVGVAAGMAVSGKIPYVYSIGTFLIMRAFEQIRNDICYQNLNVKLIGVGCGLTYSLYGATHQPIEDVGITRCLPNLVIISPGDPVEVDLATKFSLKHQGPLYLRIGSVGEPTIHKKQPNFRFGQGITLVSGKDITIIASGNMLENAYQAAIDLNKKGISTKLISMPFIKPIDKDLILKAARETKAIFTIEEHFITGGLGTAVAEVLAESSQKVFLRRIALPDKYPSEIGSRQYLREIYGLTVEHIVKTIMNIYNQHD